MKNLLFILLLGVFSCGKEDVSKQIDIDTIIEITLDGNKWELLQRNGDVIFKDERTLFEFFNDNQGQMNYISESGTRLDPFAWAYNDFTAFILFPNPDRAEITIEFSKDEFGEDMLYVNKFIIENSLSFNDVKLKKVE